MSIAFAHFPLEPQLNFNISCMGVSKSWSDFIVICELQWYEYRSLSQNSVD
jgi:hypothetical protein